MIKKRNVLDSIGWAFSSQIFREVFQFGFTIILVRLLTPRDYGIASMSWTFLTFIQVFNIHGFRSALIQKKELTDQHYISMFWFLLSLNILLYIICAAISPFIAAFFNENILINLIRVSALSFIISSAGVIHIAILERNLQFKKIGIIEIITNIFSGFVSVLMALKGFGVWSLIVGGLAGQLVALPVIWRMCTWKPSFRFCIEPLKSLLKFGGNLTGANIVNYFSRNADNIIVGKYLGSESLGYYSLAYNLMLRPLGFVTGNVARVIFPALSSIQEDKEKVRNVYIKVILYISLLTFPMMFGLYFVAKDFIILLYTSKWAPIIPIFKILCFVGALQSVTSTVGTIYMLQGRTDLLFKYTIVFSFIIVSSFFIGIHWGLIGIAVSYAIANCIVCFMANIVANKLINLEMNVYLRQLVPAAVSSSGMLFVLYVISYISNGYFGRIYLSFIGSVLIGILSYVFIVYMKYNYLLINIKSEFKQAYR